MKRFGNPVTRDRTLVTSGFAPANKVQDSPSSRSTMDDYSTTYIRESAVSGAHTRSVRDIGRCHAFRHHLPPVAAAQTSSTTPETHRPEPGGERWIAARPAGIEAA